VILRKRTNEICKPNNFSGCRDVEKKLGLGLYRGGSLGGGEEKRKEVGVKTNIKNQSRKGQTISSICY